MPTELPKPTPAQFEILDTLWRMGSPGGTTSQVWEQISAKRKVGRTTILKAIERLEKNGWLTRDLIDGAVHFWPAAERADVESQVMGDVLHGFFAGSPGNLIKGLLGSGEVTAKDAEELRQILDDATRQKKISPKKGKQT